MLNLFLEWDRVFIFSRVLRVKIFLKSCPTSEINSIFNIKTIEFSVYSIFFGFKTCFFQIWVTACNTWRDVTICCYFHTENNTFDFQGVKKTACEISHLFHKTWYFAKFNVFIDGNCLSGEQCGPPTYCFMFFIMSPRSKIILFETLTLVIPLEQWVLELWYIT